MPGWIAVGNGPIASPGDHGAAAHDRTANRHLAARCRRMGFLDGNLHE
jgi:hypothetical protein